MRSHGQGDARERCIIALLAYTGMADAEVYISYSVLLEWRYANPAAVFWDSDGWDFLCIQHHDGICRFTVVWLSLYGDSDLRGIEQCFDISLDALNDLLDYSVAIKALHKPTKGSACIDA